MIVFPSQRAGQDKIQGSDRGQFISRHFSANDFGKMRLYTFYRHMLAKVIVLRSVERNNGDV